MAISYDVAVAALAIDAPHKWIDNLLSRHRIPGVLQARQGVTRRLSRDSLTTIAVVRILCAELGIPLERAVEMAAHLSTGDDTVVTAGEGTVTISVDRGSIAQRVTARLADAVEATPQRRRGRPAAGA